MLLGSLDKNTFLNVLYNLHKQYREIEVQPTHNGLYVFACDDREYTEAYQLNFDGTIKAVYTDGEEDITAENNPIKESDTQCDAHILLLEALEKITNNKFIAAYIDDNEVTIQYFYCESTNTIHEAKLYTQNDIIVITDVITATTIQYTDFDNFIRKEL